MDFRVVMYFLGRISGGAGIAMSIPLVFSFIENESVRGKWLVGLFSCMLIMLAGVKFGRSRSDQISGREGVAITGLAWITTSLLSTLSYMLCGNLSALDGFFESVSGFSGMGGTVVVAPELLPESLLLWRSLTQWLGGLGIVVIFLAFLPYIGHNAAHMYDAESSGPEEDRVRPSIKRTAGALLYIYSAITAFAAISFFLCGMNTFDAVNHAFSSLGTGGFSTHGDSIAYFKSATVEACVTFFILAGGVSFSLYYRVYMHGWRVLKENTEFKAYLLIFAASSAAVAFVLFRDGLYSPLSALRFASFQVASMMTTTGFVSADFGLWPPFAQLVLLLLMAVGGCAGSTSAGLKVTRAVMLFKILLANIGGHVHPSSVPSVKMNGTTVPQDVLRRVAMFFFAYVSSIMILSLLITFDGVPVFDAIGMTVSAIGNAGPAFGVVGATGVFAYMPPLTKVALCAAMLLGRLEIFTMIALIRPAFWHKKRGW